MKPATSFRSASINLQWQHSETMEQHGPPSRMDRTVDKISWSAERVNSYSNGVRMWCLRDPRFTAAQSKTHARSHSTRGF